MTAIKSIYINRIEPSFSGEFIARIFNKNGIANIDKVYLEAYKVKVNDKSYRYKRAYIGVKSWHDTEAAYSFIERLRNPNLEARIIYSDDNWWSVDINDKIHKLDSKKSSLTIIKKKETYDILEKLVFIDANKTKLLREIIQGFKDKLNDSKEDNEDYIQYLKEIDLMRGIMV